MTVLHNIILIPPVVGMTVLRDIMEIFPFVGEISPGVEMTGLHNIILILPDVGMTALRDIIDIPLIAGMTGLRVIPDGERGRDLILVIQIKNFKQALKSSCENYNLPEIHRNVPERVANL